MNTVSDPIDVALFQPDDSPRSLFYRMWAAHEQVESFVYETKECTDVAILGSIVHEKLESLTARDSKYGSDEYEEQKRRGSGNADRRQASAATAATTADSVGSVSSTSSFKRKGTNLAQTGEEAAGPGERDGPDATGKKPHIPIVWESEKATNVPLLSPAALKGSATPAASSIVRSDTLEEDEEDASKKEANNNDNNNDSVFSFSSALNAGNTSGASAAVLEPQQDRLASCTRPHNVRELFIAEYAVGAALQSKVAADVQRYTKELGKINPIATLPSLQSVDRALNSVLESPADAESMMVDLWADADAAQCTQSAITTSTIQMLVDEEMELLDRKLGYAARLSQT